MPIHYGNWPEGHPNELLRAAGSDDASCQPYSPPDDDGYTGLDVEVGPYLASLQPVIPPLTFDALQDANRERGKVWGKGQDIPVLFNAVELGGECGELLNAIKKAERYKLGMPGGVSFGQSMQDIADELGDVVICCSLLANKLGIDLGAATARKFNKTSEKHGFPQRLPVAA